jgi:transcriptional regulator with XRE-family HTH domain
VSDYQTLVGEKIRKARLALKLTQEAAADTVGLDRAYFGRVERGQTNLSLATLVKISRALKIQPSSLLPAVRFPSEHPKTSKASTNPR